ncbi:MAG: hypothetical protein ACRDP6_23800 [Actinoallomurus sp.]
MSHDLADLYFGRDDAEMDIAEGGLLRAGFLPTPAYNAAAAQDDPALVTRLVCTRRSRSSRGR